jgi:hypothetical protein
MAMPADDAVIRAARPIRKGYQLIQEMVAVRYQYRFNPHIT